MHHLFILAAERKVRKIEIVEHYGKRSVFIQHISIRLDILHRLRSRSIPSSGVRVQLCDLSCRIFHFCLGAMKQMCQRAVLLPGEGLKMMGDKLGEQRRFLPAAPKLDQEALGQTPGRDTGWLQGLNCRQCLLEHGSRKPQMMQMLQLFWGQKTVLIQTLYEIGAEGQELRRKLSAFQLIPQKAFPAGQLPVFRTRLRRSIGRSPHPFVPGRQLPEGIAGRLLLFKHRVFFHGTFQKLAQILYVHLEQSDILHQLGTEFELLGQLLTELRPFHGASPPVYRAILLTCDRKRQRKHFTKRKVCEIILTLSKMMAFLVWSRTMKNHQVFFCELTAAL